MNFPLKEVLEGIGLYEQEFYELLAEYPQCLEDPCSKEYTGEDAITSRRIQLENELTAVLRLIATSFLFHSVEQNEDGTWSYQHANTLYGAPNFGKVLEGVKAKGAAFIDDPAAKLT